MRPNRSSVEFKARPVVAEHREQALPSDPVPPISRSPGVDNHQQLDLFTLGQKRLCHFICEPSCHTPPADAIGSTWADGTYDVGIVSADCFKARIGTTMCHILVLHTDRKHRLIGPEMLSHSAKNHALRYQEQWWLCAIGANRYDSRIACTS